MDHEIGPHTSAFLISSCVYVHSYLQPQQVARTSTAYYFSRSYYIMSLSFYGKIVVLPLRWRPYSLYL